MRRQPRTIALLIALIGMFGAAAVMGTTSASWNNSANFTAQVSSGNWGPPPPPPPPPPGEGGISPGNEHTVIDDIVWSISGARQFCTDVLINGTSTTTAQHWAIDVDLTQAPFYGVSANHVSVHGTGTITVLDPQTIQITGRTHGGRWDPRTNNTPITESQMAQLTICVHNVPVPPPADPSWYTVSTTQGTWTSTEACIVTTITTTRNTVATDPFFYGWTTELDLTPAKDKILGDGNVLNGVNWSPHPNGDTDMSVTPPSYNPPLDTYTVRNGFDMALRAEGSGPSSSTFTACVRGHSTNGNGKNGTAAPAMATPSVETTGAATEKVGTTLPPAGPSSTIPPAPAPTTVATPTASTPPTTTIPASEAPVPTTVDPITSQTSVPAETVPTTTIAAGEEPASP